MARRPADPAGFRVALAGVIRELDAIAEWNQGPHALSARLKKDGLQPDIDGLNTACAVLKPYLSGENQRAFHSCSRDLIWALGTVIQHATERYVDELNRTEGWRRFGIGIDDAAEALRAFLEDLPGASGVSGSDQRKTIVHLRIDDQTG